MNKTLSFFILAALCLVPGLSSLAAQSANATVTVLPNEQGVAYVRSGPGTVDFEIIGSLLPDQTVNAIGLSPGGDWIMVEFPGVPGNVAWIYKYLVKVNGELDVLQLTPTPSPAATMTVDPTLAAQFVSDAPPAAIPTFTPPPPLQIPTFSPNAPLAAETTRTPLVYIILGLGAVGLLGTIISFLPRR